MIKISKTRLLTILIVMFVLLCTTSCKSCFNKYEEMPNGITLTVSNKLKEHLLQSNLPTLHFDYNNVRVMIESDGAACFFVSNDQYELSDKFAQHISQYNKEQIYVVDEFIQEYDKGKATFDGKKLTLDSIDEFGAEQKFSKEYQLVVTNIDGTRYSYQFRTFVSEGKRYYIYRYSSNIGISMEQPLMVVKDKSGKNKLLLLALPYDTKYEVGPNSISLESLLEKDTYLEDKYSKFAYPESIKNEAETVRRDLIKNWYITYCNGTETDNGFEFSYYGAKFKLEFGITDAGNERNKDGFKIIYLGNL